MRLLFLYVVLMSNSTIGQTLREKLDGDWVCTGIFDSKGNHSLGKYGGSREYLRFSFKKNKLRISETPYDLGTVQNLNFDNATGLIELFNNVPIELPSGLPERSYKVKTLNKERLILSTTNANNKSIDYSFIKQDVFVNYSESSVVDNGVLLIKLADLSNKYITIENNIGEWFISNDSINLRPSPLFTGKGYFGDAFANTVMLPSDFKGGKLSNELICEFSVSEMGASEFRINKGISESLDKEVLRVLKKLSKNWKLNEMHPTTSKVMFHLYFIKIAGEFVSPFKID